MTGLTYGTPEDAGMDPDRIARLRDRVPQWVDGHRMRSGVLLAARRGKIVFHEAYGPLTNEPGSPPLEKDAIFNLASSTKPVTATAAMTLIEEGLLGLNRPIKEYLPEVCGEGTDGLEVQHLFTHTSGYRNEEIEQKLPARLGQIGKLAGDEAAGQHKFNARQLACLWDLKAHSVPGSQMQYCNHNYFLLGEIVRRVSGQSLHDYARGRIFEPLGMKDTFYIQDEAKLDRWVRRGEGVSGGSVKGDPMGGGEGIWAQKAPWGGNGLHSTAMDYAIFGQMFLNQGTYGGARILSPASVHEMTRNQIPGIGTEFFGSVHAEASWGLGFMVQDNERWKWGNSTLSPVGTYGHGGAGGLNFWVDPANEIVGVYFSVGLDIDEEDRSIRWNFDLFQNMVTAAVAGWGIWT